MSAYFKVFSTVAKKLKGNKSKVSPTIKSVKPSKNIKEFTKHKEDVSKSTQKFNKGLTEEGKINVRKGTNRVLSKISKILKREKKMGGGMMGRRMGYSEGRDVRKVESMIGASRSSKREKGLKKIDPEKQKGLAKLKKARPDVVKKMGYFKKGGRS